MKKNSLISVLFLIISIVFQLFPTDVVWAQAPSDSGIGVGTTNQLTINVGNATATAPTPTGVSVAPGPVIPIGTTDTLTITIGGVTTTPAPGVSPSPVPGVSVTPKPSSSPESCKKKTENIQKKSKRILEKVHFQIARIDHIWNRTVKRINKSSKNKKHFAAKIKSIGRRHDAVEASLASAEASIKDMKDCDQARKAGKEFIKKIRKLQSRLESYKTAVEDTIRAVRDAENTKGE